MNSSVEAEEMTIFFKEDTYGGVIIDPKSITNFSAEAFGAELDSNLETWQTCNKRGVWLKIPTAQSHLVPVAVSRGFDFHHASPGAAMLTKWLPSTPCTLPHGPSHQVGVGAFVLNESNEMLVVQEKSGPVGGMDFWKVPTGLINSGEDLGDAAIREVKEETGVDAKVDSILMFRHSHGFNFGTSDLWFVVKMIPTTFELTAQESEIAAVRWMPVEEFQEQPRLKNSPLHAQVGRILAASKSSGYEGVSYTKLLSRISSSREAYLYHNKL
eukprot:CAMPEP_0113951592 /NCGR_PEP_ID=MMETSP1339-20121228/87011_1 /TAXON_ID=94617 /ORGANISM="Fibrocapsa japonica" /LENGTH=269 /DNA_ID=CAMNT_0000959901 /DNA_START=270 /DNA_END=1079 /DNA_ORIENTATION=- /assembly_acc=CAM_ASM_000762